MRARSVEVSRRRFLGGAGVAVASATVPGLVVGCSADPPPPLAPAPPERSVRRVLAGLRTREGAGVLLSRTIGSPALPLLDPFLLLDEIRSDRPDDYVRGFPRHPHRGFETVTYMIEGTIEHRDSVGNEGRLGPGATQWMTAGHGIVHSEMPKQDSGMLWGLQLWVNLPAARKMTPPRYQDVAPARIPELAVGGARVRLVAGTLGGERGPIEGIAIAPTMLDVTVPAGASFQHALPRSHTAFAFVIDGVVALGPEATHVERGAIAILGEGSAVLARSESGGRFLLVTGEPIGEPVARRGPFVMNTEAELDQAFADYQSGRLTSG